MPHRLLAVLLLLGALVLAPAAGAAATTPTGGSGSTTAPGTQVPSPDQATDYDDGVGGPHQDTPEEMTGRAVSTGTVVFIVAVLLVTAAVVVALVVRGRRRAAEGRDLL
ncbi:hypothetical protein [uncultured Cellulomonas sp.]|uniref:hypothetical protein n=1 Tax=uncultured Cellulomonas sp. TaxID=189682 RepID=UPI0028E3FE4B|nr:hypothetical protein [uncultured Cellulomonas sp.]